MEPLDFAKSEKAWERLGNWEVIEDGEQRLLSTRAFQ